MDEWRHLLQDYFGTSLTDQEEKRWFSEIRQRYQFVNNDRLCRAIRWASDPANWKHEARRVTVPEVITWIKLSYRQENNANQPNLSCRACDGHRWVGYVKTLNEQCFTFAEYINETQVVIPCACSLGRTVMSKTYPQVSEQRQLEIARRAVKQRIEFLRIGDLLPAFDPKYPFRLSDEITQDLPYDKTESVVEQDGEELPF